MIGRHPTPAFMREDTEPAEEHKETSERACQWDFFFFFFFFFSFFLLLIAPSEI
jgi:hypothetical protein